MGPKENFCTGHPNLFGAHMESGRSGLPQWDTTRSLQHTRQLLVNKITGGGRNFSCMAASTQLDFEWEPHT
jgi:hypothetical protein